MSKQDKLMKTVSDGTVIGGTAVVYVVGSNEGLRRVGMGYGSRALLASAAGILGGLAAGGYAPRIGVGLIVGGIMSGAINGINALNVARYRGATGQQRAALPGSQPAQGLPAPQGMRSVTDPRVAQTVRR